MRLPDKWLVHEVQVKPHTGAGAYGDTYGDPFPLRCMAQGALRRVRDGGGVEHTSTLTLIAAPGDADKVPVGSLVTWRGDEHEVLASIEHDDQGLGAPQHAEVVCE